MPLTCKNIIYVEKDKKHKWKWHKDLGWQIDTSNTVSNATPISNTASTPRQRGFMKDSLSNK